MCVYLISIYIYIYIYIERERDRYISVVKRLDPGRPPRGLTLPPEAVDPGF